MQKCEDSASPLQFACAAVEVILDSMARAVRVIPKFCSNLLYPVPFITDSERPPARRWLGSRERIKRLSSLKRPKRKIAKFRAGFSKKIYGALEYGEINERGERHFK